MFQLSNKQISILKVLRDRSLIIVPWTNRDLLILEQMKFAQGQVAYAANGRVHSSKVWTITEAGRHFLETERAGQ